MPIYEFVCKECAHITEQYFNLSEMNSVLTGELTPLCEKCHSKKTILIMSVAHNIVNGYNEKNGYS